MILPTGNSPFTTPTSRRSTNSPAVDRIGLALAVLLALTACSSDPTPVSVGGASTSTTAGKAPTSPTSAGLPVSSTAGPAPGSGAAASGTGAVAGERCHTAGLAVALGAGEPGAGQRYVSIVLTNVSGQTCSIVGFGGLQLLDETRRPLPTDVVRADVEPGTIEVVPGASVTQQVQFSAVAGPGDAPTGDCQPTPRFAEVTPPEETNFLVADWIFGPVCEQGHLVQQPYTG